MSTTQNTPLADENAVEVTGETSIEQTVAAVRFEMTTLKAKAALLPERQWGEELARALAEKDREEEKEKEAALWASYLAAHPVMKRFYERRESWNKYDDQLIIAFRRFEAMVGLINFIWLLFPFSSPPLRAPIINAIVTLLSVISFAEWLAISLQAGSDWLTSNAPFVRAFQRRCRPHWLRPAFRTLFAIAVIYLASSDYKEGAKQIGESLTGIVMGWKGCFGV